LVHSPGGSGGGGGAPGPGGPGGPSGPGGAGDPAHGESGPHPATASFGAVPAPDDTTGYYANTSVSVTPDAGARGHSVVAPPPDGSAPAPSSSSSPPALAGPQDDVPPLTSDRQDQKQLTYTEPKLLTDQRGSERPSLGPDTPTPPEPAAQPMPAPADGIPSPGANQISRPENDMQM
jgi:hypothetical protein